MFKKILITLVLLAIVLAAALFFFGGPALNKGIRNVVVDYGPKMTGTTVQLDAVNLSAFNGSGTLSGLVIGNPSGFSTEKAMSLGKAELQVVPMSVLGATIQIKRIAIDAPEIIVEQANGTTNLQRIQKNIETALGPQQSAPEPEEKPAESGPGKKLSIEEFVLSNASVTIVAFGQNKKVTLPTIRLTDLGTKEGGVPPAEIAKEVMAAVTKEVGKQAQQFGMQFLQDPAGNIDAAKEHLKKLQDQAKNLNSKEDAVNALKGFLGGKKKDKDSGGTGD